MLSVSNSSLDLYAQQNECVSVWCPDLFVQPSSDHRRDIGIPFNGLLSLPKAVHLATGPGALKHTQTSIAGFHEM